jgi:hypothetical protein
MPIVYAHDAYGIINGWNPLLTARPVPGPAKTNLLLITYYLLLNYLITHSTTAITNLG